MYIANSSTRVDTAQLYDFSHNASLVCSGLSTEIFVPSCEQQLYNSLMYTRIYTALILGLNTESNEGLFLSICICLSVFFHFSNVLHCGQISNIRTEHFCPVSKWHFILIIIIIIRVRQGWISDTLWWII